MSDNVKRAGFGDRLDSLIAPLAPGLALKRRQNRMRFEMSGGMYRGADTSRTLSDFVLGGIGKDADPSSYERKTLRDRCRDLTRNNPIAVSAQETMAHNVVGQGLQLQSRIRSEDLGVSEERAQELRRQAESVYAEWGRMASSDNQLTIDEIQFMTLLSLVDAGEVFVVPGWASEPWRPYGRILEMVEAERVAHPSGGRVLSKEGIEYGDRGQPIGYWVERAKVGPGKRETVRVPAFDDKGRPAMLHLYRGKRFGQRRGVPILAPVIEAISHMSSYLEAELIAKRTEACLAVFFTMDMDPMDAATGKADATQTSSTDRKRTLEPGMMEHLRPGEGVNVVDPSRPGDSFEPFVFNLLNFIAMGLGMPHELLVKNFSKTNYSSARAALLEARRMFKGWRKWLAVKLLQPVYELVLEEAWMRGNFDAPDFWENKAALCRANWVGGAWGVIEPVKEANAAKIRMETLVSNRAIECAALGEDWEDVQAQARVEREKALEGGLVQEPQKGANNG